MTINRRVYASMDAHEVMEYVDQAFGIGGFAKKDKWTTLYALRNIKLEGDVSAVEGVMLASWILVLKQLAAKCR